MKIGHCTTVRKENGLTIAERDQIDAIINGMSREYQERALMNIDPELLVNEIDRRFKTYSETLAEIERVYLKRSNMPLNVVTARDNILEYIQVIRNIKK